jgi:hypothetical protein
MEQGQLTNAERSRIAIPNDNSVMEERIMPLKEKEVLKIKK